MRLNELSTIWSLYLDLTCIGLIFTEPLIVLIMYLLYHQPTSVVEYLCQSVVSFFTF